MALLAGCYRAPSPGEPCAIRCSDTCPAGLTCEGGFCLGPGEVCRPSFAQLTAGTGFACGLDDGGALWCWGSNTRRQIDPGERLQFPLATRIDGRTWEAIDAGGEHVCGISAGELYCWGRNDRAQVAPISGDVATPILISVPDGPSRWTAVSAGLETTCAIGDGKLYCWGGNRDGVAGVGSSDAEIREPTAAASDLTDWIAVDVGSTHACGVSAAAGVYCWGNGFNGRSGPSASIFQLSPVLALAEPSVAVAASEEATCAATAAGVLMCWGRNADGELGPSNPTVGESATPLIASTIIGWTAVTAAEDKLCGLAGDAVYCWGRANLGGLGNGVWTDEDRFGKVLTGARAVSLGWNRDVDVFGVDRRELELGCALAGTDIACWGDNRYGQLGRGGATMALAPEEIAGGLPWLKLSLGQSHGCGIVNGVVGGTLFCWGSTTSGQTIGMQTGSSTPRTPCMENLDCDLGTPKSIDLALDVTGVATGTAHTCALHGSGLISCWGDNGRGQLGSNAMAPFKREVPPPGGRPWRQLIATGRDGQCASPGGPEVWCWGNVLSQHAPMRETALEGVRAIGAGDGMACVLDGGGLLHCAGNNGQGQFGTGKPPGFCGDTACNNGETASSCSLDCGAGPLTPTGRAYAALAVSATRPFACGLRPDGGVECWGANERGQTGAFDANNNMLIHPTFTPSPVVGLSACTAVTAGDLHACAICDGRIHCWGDGSVGALGAGPLTRDPVPVPRAIELVLAGDPWVDLHAGRRFSCARSAAGRAYCWGSDPHAGLGNGATSANLPVTVLATPAR